MIIFLFLHTRLFFSHNRAFGDEINQPTRPVFFPMYFLTFNKHSNIFYTLSGKPPKTDEYQRGCMVDLSCAKIVELNLAFQFVHGTCTFEEASV